jgi:hypothetical protein
MAEFLILKKPHWATPSDVTPDDGPFPIAKYNARQIPGDITSVKPDGFYRVEALGQGTHGWNRETWNLVRAPKITYEAAVGYAASLFDNTDPNAPTLKRKWRFYIENFSSLPWVKNMVTINGVTVEECYLDFTTLKQIRDAIKERVAI